MTVGIVERKAADLLRPAHGARKRISAQQKRDLQASLARNGMVQPLVVRKATGEVVIGDVRAGSGWGRSDTT